MGAGKTTLAAQVAERLDRPFVDTDAEVERAAGMSVSELFDERGEAAFRGLEESESLAALARPEPLVVALGGGALTSERTRTALRSRALTVLVEVEPDEAWARVSGGERPLAREPTEFHHLHAERQPLYRDAADAAARDADDVVLAAGAVVVEDVPPGATVLGVPARARSVV
jgi:shikimate kinase